MLIVLGLIKRDVDGILAGFLLHGVVVTWREGVDINYATVRKDLIVNKRREALTTKTEPDVAARCCIQQASLSWIDAFQQLHWLTLLLEVNKIFVVLEDLDVCEGSPGVLDFLCCHDLFRFLCHFTAALLVATPGPLDLDGRDMVHSEPMIFEETPCKGHLVGRLDQARAKVTHALLLIFGHHVETRSQKLLSQALCC